MYQFKTKPALQQLTSPPVPLVSEEEEVDSQKDHFTNTSQLSESTDSVVSDGDDFTPGVYTTLVTKPLDLTSTEVSSDSKDFCATEQGHFITTVSQENQFSSQGKKLLTIHPQIKKLITVCRKILGNCDPRRLLKKAVTPNSSATPKKPTSQLFTTIMGLKKNPKLFSYYGLLMKRVKTFRAKKPFSFLVKKKVKESSADHQPPPFSQAN